MKDLVSLADWPQKAMLETIDLGIALKRRPGDYARAMERRTLVMLFEKPSLRTRISFEIGMTQMGGHAIYYDLGTSPLGAGKETVEDTAKVLSRYADVIMARLFSHATIAGLARHATVPVINGLTNDEHPTQILADLMTIVEHKRRLKGLTLAYLGDGCNNVTHSLMLGCAKVGMSIRVACPREPAFSPDPKVLKRALKIARTTGAAVDVTDDAARAIRGADVVYTDSWMSYHIPEEQMAVRRERFMPYQITGALMRKAAKDAIFMHCLPAVRGCEVTAEVIDGPQSVVFDEAENRLHIHKAIMLRLLDACLRAKGSSLRV